MGFDLYGRKAKNEKGKYFRNNVWWWRPLACYVLNNVELPKAQQDWFMNNNCQISKLSSEKIAKEMQKLVDNGKAAKYEKEYMAGLKKMKKVKCNICAGIGKRKDAPEIGAGKIKCNGCSGTGKTEPFAKHYPFSVENLKEFIEFAENSGGFGIC